MSYIKKQQGVVYMINIKKNVAITAMLILLPLPGIAKVVQKHFKFVEYTGKTLSTEMCKKIFPDFSAKYNIGENKWENEGESFKIDKDHRVYKLSKKGEYEIGKNLKLVVSTGSTTANIDGTRYEIDWTTSGLLNRSEKKIKGLLISNECTLKYIETKTES
jgi:hypothetical protein